MVCNIVKIITNGRCRDYNRNSLVDLSKGEWIVRYQATQETRTGADITGDEAMISSIINSSCLHCAFVRVLNPELEELSDEEIIKNHSDKRQNAKAPRFCLN